jgi:cell division protein ZapA (FtsZ GTPase activity inhibitor)
VTLEIAGTKFRLVADADAQHLNELAALVNERVARLGGASRPASAAQLLALVALGLADDLNTCEKKLRDIEQLTRNTIQNVITRIDNRLALGTVSLNDGEQQDETADAHETDADHDIEHEDAGERVTREDREALTQLSLPGAPEPTGRAGNHVGEPNKKLRTRDDRDRS